MFRHVRHSVIVTMGVLATLILGVLPDSAGAARVHPRLAQDLAADPTGSHTVWITFADKGEEGDADLTLRLAEAEANLTPRARARRLRAGVDPIVDYRDLPLHADYLVALEARGLQPYGASRWFNQVAVRVDAAVVNEIATLPFVAELRAVDVLARALPLPVDESAATALPAQPLATSGAMIDYGNAAAQAAQINVPAVHDSGYIGTGVLVAVMDSGFDGHETHQALAGLDVPPGHKRDFVQGDTTVTGHGHGTYVLGCIAGNLPGTYVGTGFGATFALARTEYVPTETRQEMVYWQMAAEWADSLGADVFTTSLGYYLFDDPAENYSPDSLDGETTIIARAGQIAASKGILLVNSAGNTGTSPAQWLGKIVTPADVHGDSLIAVGAVNSAGTRASFSGMGPTADGRIKPDLMARGSLAWVISSASATGYFQASGTSFSAPIVTGLVACIMQARPQWSAVDVIQALRQSADRFNSPDTLYGYGIPNGLLALQWTSTLGVAPPLVRPNIQLLGPNPLRSDGPDTRVRFALDADAAPGTSARVRVYDPQGRLVRQLWSGSPSRGQPITVSWDGRNEAGERTAGLFFITLDAAGRRQSVRVVSLP